MRLLSMAVASSQRTDGSRLNHVADGESLDRLILGGASRAVAAADGLGVAAALLVAAAVKMLASNSHDSRLCHVDNLPEQPSIRNYIHPQSDTKSLIAARRREQTEHIRRDSYLFFLFLTILAVSGLNC